MTASEPISKKRENKWAWIWFGYTGFLFITPILEPTRYLWLGTIAVFLAFVVIMWGYIRAVDEGRPARFWMIAATFALGLITFPWNQGGSTFFVYSAAFLPFTFDSLRRVFSVFFAEALLVLAEGAIFHAVPGVFHISWPNTFIAIFLMTVIGGGNVFFAQQRRADCQLREALNENLALASVAERERIARDLHDVLGHTLSVIVLKAELAGRLINRQDPNDHTRAAAEIADVERIARTALAEVREAIGGYRTRGLGAEIEAARLTLDAAGVTLILDSAATSTANLSAPEEIALSLALREAVTNIVRHSRATTCRLRFITEDSHRRLVIEDNGANSSSQSSLIREGNGLRGMRQRIESLGGHLFLEYDNGTRLLIDLPLREPAAS
jgi:two-component system, NarL family, sensor histidine kinase DesK